jgi:hypothetical protein
MSGLIDGNTAPTGGDSPRETDDTDSIRSSLASALASAETPETSEPAKVTSEVPEGDDEASKGERKRGADGKFVKAEGEPEPEVVEPVVDPNAAPVDPNAPDPAAVVEPTTQAPVTLSKEDRELYAKLPPDAQTIIRNVVKRQDGEFTRKTQAIAALKNEYEPVSKIFEPYKRPDAAGRVHPAHHHRGMGQRRAAFDARRGRRRHQVAGPELQDRPEPAGRCDRHPARRGSGPQQAQPEFYIDPATGQIVYPQPQYQPQELEALVKQRLDAALGPIQQRLEQDDRQRAIAEQQARIANATRIDNEVEQFRNSQDDKGALQHPHFEEVEPQMVAFVRAAIANGQTPQPLKELYETAVWANPSTRAKEIAARETAQREKASAEARAKAAAARQAGSSVTGAPGTGQTQVAPKAESLREQLEEAAADAA